MTTFFEVDLIETTTHCGNNLRSLLVFTDVHCSIKKSSLLTVDSAEERLYLFNDFLYLIGGLY